MAERCPVAGPWFSLFGVALERALIDVTIKNGGRFFLPYQLHYTAKELLASYPQLPAFLATKRHYDPTELFSSTFYRGIKALSGVA